MCNSGRKAIDAALLLFIVAAMFCVKLRAQEPELRNLTWAQEFLGTLYPSVKDQTWVMSVKTVFLFGSPIQALGNMDVHSVPLNLRFPGFNLGEPVFWRRI